MTQTELDTLKTNRRQIHRLKSQLDSLCEPIGAVPITGMPSGGGGKNAVEAIVVQKETLQAEIEALQQESRCICDQIEPPRTRQVFLLFYAEGMTWVQIAEEMGYTEDSTPRKLRNQYVKRHVRVL